MVHVDLISGALLRALEALGCRRRHGRGRAPTAPRRGRQPITVCDDLCFAHRLEPEVAGGRVGRWGSP